MMLEYTSKSSRRRPRIVFEGYGHSCDAHRCLRIGGKFGANAFPRPFFFFFFLNLDVVQMGKTSGRGNLRTSKRHVPLIQIIHDILLINLIVQRSWVVRVLCSLPAVRDLGILTHRPAYFLIRTLQVAIGADECCTQCQGAQGCQAFAWQAWTSGTFSPFLSTLCSSLATL